VDRARDGPPRPGARSPLNSRSHGTDFYTAVNELEKEGAPPNEAGSIAACAQKVNCTDLVHCGP
jgi:hypothetical protein